MKLTHLRVQNFKSILDTGRISVGELCCLVGKNEAGKTATLTALQSLRPFGDPMTKFDVTEDYPRRFATRYDERHPDADATVVETWWELSSKAHQILVDEFGEDAITGREFTISKRYKQEGTSWTLPISERKAIENAIATHRLNAAEKKVVEKATTVKSLITAISGQDSPTEKLAALSKQFSDYRKQSVVCRGIDLVSDLVPTFFYTSHYDRMSGQISAQKIAQDKQQGNIKPGDEIFLNFLRLAGTDLDELNQSPRYEELNAKCEAASADITDQIFEYWSQNKYLEVQVQLNEGRQQDPAPFNSGAVARARVYNQLHRASVPFSERSAGFVWFFSFLVQFAMMRRQTDNVIILLDEPGLTLHGKAQEDLLRYIEEKLLPAHQVLFSTHSPFMVPAKRLADCRVVEDVVDLKNPARPQSLGTKITEDVMSTDKDTLFPLQGALGYSVTQSLFVGENSLLVEGPSDILYLQAFSNELERRGRKGLNPKWTMTPAGGIDNVRPFVSLFQGNHLNVAVLSDQGQGDKGKIERLRRSEILAAERLHTIAELLDQAEADIEDVMHPEFFCKLINGCYGLEGDHAITTEKLVASDGAPRQVKQAESYFNLLPTEIPEYSHYRPADWLIRNPEILDGDTPDVIETLTRAEKVFEVYNAMLN
ncbi:AAA family ATPase [Mameliella alba]|uniref:ATP-dependent endonuclease of the OLD family-like protein n=1 Tax=Mameliella alba TaxID=561184 RepID=A0A0B3SUG9_9RHOB|nr:AAA family ATPase [Mameliella alba]KHQ54104.1 ATP-dependent endonuclease of the OLD family-like protein [Mameliella alba]